MNHRKKFPPIYASNHDLQRKTFLWILTMNYLHALHDWLALIDLSYAVCFPLQSQYFECLPCFFLFFFCCCLSSVVRLIVNHSVDTKIDLYRWNCLVEGNNVVQMGKRRRKKIVFMIGSVDYTHSGQKYLLAWTLVVYTWDTTK